MSAAPDRAAAVTTAILKTVTDALRRWDASGDIRSLTGAQAAIMAMLRKEFADITKTTTTALSELPSRSTGSLKDGKTHMKENEK
jgi:hypothetical protein